MKAEHIKTSVMVGMTGFEPNSGSSFIKSLKFMISLISFLIIADTVEIKADMEHIGKYKRIKCVALIGKEPMAQQLHDLKQKHHIISATPGRLSDC